MKFLQFAFVFASATLALAQVAPYQVAGVAGTDVAPVPAKVVPVPVKVPAQQYYSPARYPGNYYQGYPGYNGYQGYYNQGYYQPSYYQNSGYYQQPAAYYQNSGYYQQPAAYYNNGQQASVTGFFSSPYANYALPGAGNPVGAVSAVSSAPVAASSATKK
ncbi:hypothetical protein M8J75_007020 [Diaphorina citri]|nr:hypothetical protein M8J75_007020 [Diaphorina citri]